MTNTTQSKALSFVYPNVNDLWLDLLEKQEKEQIRFKRNYKEFTKVMSHMQKLYFHEIPIQVHSSLENNDCSITLSMSEHSPVYDTLYDIQDHLKKINYSIASYHWDTHCCRIVLSARESLPSAEMIKAKQENRLLYISFYLQFEGRKNDELSIYPTKVETAYNIYACDYIEALERYLYELVN